MKFLSEIKISKELDITHQQKVMMFGSCFSTYMGTQFHTHRFQTLCNPLGILFNPCSILSSLQRIHDNREVQTNELFETEGVWNSYDFHSQFAQLSEKDYLNNINTVIQNAHDFFCSTEVFFITLGTAWIYELKETNQVVANCHKQPANYFTRRRLSLEECTSTLQKIVQLISEVSPSTHIVFTVSPIRHWKDGAHENQLSKSTLLLSIDQLIHQSPNVHYFPSYEILMDELRDYRFYAEDLFHPSEQAQKYIWEKLCEYCFSNETIEINKSIEEINAALAHRPFNAESESHLKFINKTQEKIEQLKLKYPYITL